MQILHRMIIIISSVISIAIIICMTVIIVLLLVLLLLLLLVLKLSCRTVLSASWKTKALPRAPRLHIVCMRKLLGWLDN